MTRKHSIEIPKYLIYSFIIFFISFLALIIVSEVMTPTQYIIVNITPHNTLNLTEEQSKMIEEGLKRDNCTKVNDTYRCPLLDVTR